MSGSAVGDTRYPVHWINGLLDVSVQNRTQQTVSAKAGRDGETTV